MTPCDCPQGIGPIAIKRGLPIVILSLLLFSMFLTSCNCEEFTEPIYYDVVDLYGTPYERGYTHGVMFADKIRSIYTMLLTNSIFPYLNRERPDIASVLLRYQDDEEYGDGQFSYKMMCESAWSVAETLPTDYLDEMQGIADGADLPFEEILILNTFFDSLMGFRSITLFIRLMQAPRLLSIEFMGLSEDGVDNDGDGEIDEFGEGVQSPYDPLFHATMVEVPTDTKIRFELDDDLEGVKPELIRIQLGEEIFVYGDGAFEVLPLAREGKSIQVILTPPDGLPEASAIPIILQSGDRNELNDPPPIHARFMRDERITFTTVGYGEEPQNVENRGESDGRSQPPSLGFAVRKSATKNGETIVGHNFAMLDSNATHKHTVLFIHHPDEGKQFAILTWTGLLGGFSGINEDGFTYLTNTSDTLNNPFVKRFNEALIFAKLYGAGIPVGIMGREMLQNSADVNEGLDYISRTYPTFGWNFLLADQYGDMAAVEVDSDIMEDEDGGVYIYDPDPTDPENLNEYGQPYASVGDDDLRIASHYMKNTNEIEYSIITFNIREQRYWSSFFFRSLKAFYVLGEKIEDQYGELDVKAVQRILADAEMEDQRDGMNSAIYQPENLTVHFAMGQVPPTSGPYIEYDLTETFGKGGLK